MDELINLMKRVLADSFTMSLKAKYFHWNVEGHDFYQLHTLFGEVYGEIDGSVDAIAEHIRTLNSYAPGSLRRFSELTTIESDDTISTGFEMVAKLDLDNRKVLEGLTLAASKAEELGKRGILNFLEGRIDAHDKHGWMLRSVTKNV